MESIQQAQELWNAAPHPIQDATSLFIPIMVILTTILKSKNVAEIKPMNNILLNLKQGNFIKHTDAEILINQVHNTYIVDNRVQIINCLSQTNVACQHNLINGVESILRDKADSLLKFNLFSNFAGIVIESIRLWNFWDSIKEAENLVGASGIKRQQISQSLNAIIPEIAILNNYIEQLNGTNSEHIRLNTTTQIWEIKLKTEMQIGEIRLMLNNIKHEISNLRIKINNKIVSFEQACRQSKYSMVGSLITGIVTSGEVYFLMGVGNPWLLALNGVTAGLSFVFAVTNVNLYYISQKELNNLAEELNFIDVLEKERQNLQAKVEELAMQAENLGDWSGIKRKQISQWLDGIITDIATLNNYIEQLNNGTNSEIIRFKTMRQIETIKLKLNDIKHEISILKIEIKLYYISHKELKNLAVELKFIDDLEKETQNLQVQVEELAMQAYDIIEMTASGFNDEPIVKFVACNTISCKA